VYRKSCTFQLNNDSYGLLTFTTYSNMWTPSLTHSSGSHFYEVIISLMFIIIVGREPICLASTGASPLFKGRKQVKALVRLLLIISMCRGTHSVCWFLRCVHYRFLWVPLDSRGKRHEKSQK